jgi:hypothetical protein
MSSSNCGGVLEAQVRQLAQCTEAGGVGKHMDPWIRGISRLILPYALVATWQISVFATLLDLNAPVAGRVYNGRGANGLYYCATVMVVFMNQPSSRDHGRHGLPGPVRANWPPSRLVLVLGLLLPVSLVSATRALFLREERLWALVAAVSLCIFAASFLVLCFLVWPPLRGETLSAEFKRRRGCRSGKNDGG